MRKVVIWFAVVLIMAIYIKVNNLLPNTINKTGQVMGENSSLTKSGR